MLVLEAFTRRSISASRERPAPAPATARVYNHFDDEAPVQARMGNGVKEAYLAKRLVTD
jgi:hypothetical protein